MTAPTLGPQFEEALLFAVRVHAGDLRKGTDVPYVSHLLSVCALVMEDGGRLRPLSRTPSYPWATNSPPATYIETGSPAVHAK